MVKDWHSEIFDDFAQRAAETLLDLSYLDAHHYFPTDAHHHFAVALRAANIGYGWEFDGNQEFVSDWKTVGHIPVVQYQARRPIGPYTADIAALITGPKDKKWSIAICIDDINLTSARQIVEAAGYRYMDFSFKRVADDPIGCAREVGLVISDLIDPRPHFWIANSARG